MSSPYRYRTPKVARDAMAIVAAIGRCDVATINGPGQDHAGSWRRRLVVGLLDGFAPHLSSNRVGDYLFRDHSTITEALGRHRAYLTRDAGYAEQFETARLALIALGHDWRGPTSRRGRDADRRLKALRRNWRTKYQPAHQARRDAARAAA